MKDAWTTTVGAGALVAVSIHAGHDIRGEVAELLHLDEPTRLREEDPYTDHWITIAPTHVRVHRSRFEVDLNRPRETAVYLEPEDAWGLRVWDKPLPKPVIERSLELHDSFYAHLACLLRHIIESFGSFVLLDLHSYNHRRSGPDGVPSPALENPQVNVGTGTLPEKWGPIARRFMADLSRFELPEGPLDVRENIKFRGGYLSRWVHESFPGTGCALAVEFKKFFMDEWSGEPHWDMVRAIREALSTTVPGLLQERIRL